MKDEKWNIVDFSELISVLTDYHSNGAYSKLKENVELFDKEDYALMIRTTNFEKNDFVGKNKYITEKAYNFLSKSKVFEEDLIMNKIANPGSIYFAPKLNRPISLAMNLFLIRINKDKANPKFIYYYLKVNEKYVKSFALGTVTKTITKEAVRNLQIKLPPLIEQNSITNIINAFDDKIELLTAQNKTLETMAQTIFKEWFGKYQIGDELPEGWRVGVYDDLVRLSSGKGVKKSEYIENGLYKIFGANGVIGRLDKFLIKEKVIITGRVGTLGTVFILNYPCWMSDNVLISKPIMDNSFYFSYFTLKSFNFSSLNTGSTQPLITQGDLKSVGIIIPNATLLQEFEKFSISIFEKVETNNSQVQSLTKTRDTLLPKLMSGQIRVNNLKQTVDD